MENSSVSKKKVFSFKRKNSYHIKTDYESIIINILSNQQENSKSNKEKPYQELLLNKNHSKIKEYPKNKILHKNKSPKEYKISSIPSNPFQNHQKVLTDASEENQIIYKNNNKLIKCKSTGKREITIKKNKNIDKKKSIVNISKYSNSKINNDIIWNLNFKNNCETIINEYKSLDSKKKINKYKKKSNLNLKLNYKQQLNTEIANLKNNKTLNLISTVTNSKKKDFKIKNIRLDHINLNTKENKNTRNKNPNNQSKKKYAIPIVSANIFIETNNLTENNNSKTLDNEKYYSNNITRRKRLKKIGSFKIKRDQHLMKRYNSTKQISDFCDDNDLFSDNNVDILTVQERKLEEIQNELEKNKSDELSTNLSNNAYMKTNRGRINNKIQILDNAVSYKRYKKRGILLNELRKIKSNSSKKIKNK